MQENHLWKTADRFPQAYHCHHQGTLLIQCCEAIKTLPCSLVLFGAVAKTNTVWNPPNIMQWILYAITTLV